LKRGNTFPNIGRGIGHLVTSAVRIVRRKRRIYIVDRFREALKAFEKELSKLRNAN